MSYPLDDMDWFTMFEVTCRKCGITRLYKVRDLLNLRYRNLYYHDLQFILTCARGCGGSQKVALPGGEAPPQAPMPLRLDYAFERARRARLLEQKLAFHPMVYLELPPFANSPCELKNNRHGVIDQDTLPVREFRGLPIYVSDRIPGGQLMGRRPDTPPGSSVAINI